MTLLRHAHAHEHADDRARPLSERGRSAARESGASLRAAGWIPELILTSPALRARTTAEIVAGACAPTARLVEAASLYLASPAQYLRVLQDTPSDVRSVLLVGHNPGLSALAHDLCRHPRELAPAEIASRELELDSWLELGAME